jgi:anthranilate 1,2-dioxygenase (deaminating, decarboxylating) large subunit
MKNLRLLTLALAVLCFAAPAFALSQPAVNLGFTNFLDGASPGPGMYWTEYLQVIHSSDIKGPNGHDIKGPTGQDIDVSGFINLNQFIYQSDVTFLGGNPGIDVIIPLVDLDADFPLNAEDGVGDILVGPFIQWGPHMLFDRPFFHRFEFQVTAPTGENNNDTALNPGADLWTINPYYAFTYFITPKLSTSWRIHYLWSSENDDFSDALPNVDLQPGHSIHLNYAVAYAVTDTLRLGVAGYYLKQLEEDEYDGVGLDNSEEEVFAIGPGLVWHINKELTFMGAVNFETEAENRPEGVRSTLRLIWKFW